MLNKQDSRLSCFYSISMPEASPHGSIQLILFCPSLHVCAEWDTFHLSTPSSLKLTLPLASTLHLLVCFGDVMSAREVTWSNQMANGE